MDLVTDRTERVSPGSVLFTPSGELRVVHSVPHKRRWIVAFEGVADHAGAEALRGAVLSAEPLHDPAALWVHELVGSEVVSVDGRRHGTVVCVEANPASDLLVLDDGALVPLRFVVASEADRVVIDPPEGLLG